MAARLWQGAFIMRHGSMFCGASTSLNSALTARIDYVEFAGDMTALDAASGEIIAR
jgi:hypothetical protein